MNLQHAVIVEQIRNTYENREAIYFEKGVLRVRVHNIHIDTHNRRIEADVEEIFTPGLGTGIFYKPVWNEGRPRRWSIGGQLASCWDVVWTMGYGGWALYFSTAVIEGIVALAASWPADLSPVERHYQILNWGMVHNVIESQPKQLFPD